MGNPEDPLSDFRGSIAEIQFSIDGVSWDAFFPGIRLGAVKSFVDRLSVSGLNFLRLNVVQVDPSALSVAPIVNWPLLPSK